MFETQGFLIVCFYCVRNGYCLVCAKSMGGGRVERDGHGRAKAMAVVGQSHSPCDDAGTVARTLALSTTAVVGIIMRRITL